MQNKKIVIAGGTGFIGQQLVRYFGKNNEIIILSRGIPDAFNNRNRYDSLKKEDLINTSVVIWDGKNTGDWANFLNGADILINLAGKSVNCRYNEKNKKEIFDSRTNAVNALGKAIALCSKPPRLWVNASSATIYRHAEDHAQDEYSKEYRDDFSVQVCKKWEKTFNEQIVPSTRKIILRMAINLGPGGLMIPYFNLLKFGLGGRQGNGKQMYSWVHVEDTCRIIEWIEEDPQMEGIYNCASPNPVTNKEFMRLLRKAAGHYFGLPAFTWMLKIGGLIIGTESELVLKSRWVIPTRLLESGYQFKFPLLSETFKDILSNVPRKQYHLF